MEFTSVTTRTKEIKQLLRSYNVTIINIGGDTETCKGDIISFQLHGGPFNEHITFTNPEVATKNFLDTVGNLPVINGRMYVIWFHNLSFDLPALFPSNLQNFYDREFDFSIGDFQISGVFDNLNFATIRRGKLKIELLDTLAYFKASLDDLTKIFAPDLRKLATPKGLGDKVFTERDKYFTRYAVRDVQGEQKIGEFISEMHSEFEIPISVSAPHMASRIFRKHFLTAPIPLTPKNITYASLYSYHGGKNNYVGDGVQMYKDVRTIDIKSAYPFAMHGLPAFSDAKLYKALSGQRGSIVPSLGVYKISGHAVATDYPIIYTHNFKPIVDRKFEKVWVTGWELNRGLETGLITVDSIYGFYYDAPRDKVESPFRGYVEHFYFMKETATSKGRKDFYKLLMNSLYGKFVETRGSGSKLLNMHYDIDSGEHYEKIELKGGTLFHPFIASQITGHTRAYIHGLEVRYKAIHTATDGIMTHAKRAPLSKELGGLDIEADGDVLIFRNKLYIFYTRDKSKAIKDKKGELRKSTIFRGKYICKFGLHGYFGTVEQLEQMYKSGIYEYEFTKVNKLRESIRRGLKVNEFVQRDRVLNLKGNTNGKR